jgi:hypothetical protein
MVFQKGGCVYIMTNKMHTVLYVGVSSDLTGGFGSIKTNSTPIVLQLNIIAINWFIISFIRALKKQLQLKTPLKVETGKIK